jgi:membrane-bound lytic murein transglycosylase D
MAQVVCGRVVRLLNHLRWLVYISKSYLHFLASGPIIRTISRDAKFPTANVDSCSHVCLLLPRLQTSVTAYFPTDFVSIIRGKTKMYQKRWLTGLILAIAALWVTDVFADSVQSAEFPSLVSVLRAIGPVDFCGEAVPLESQEIQERYEKELLLSVWDRPQVILWLKRSHRYFPHIEKMLKESEMPDDLKYVAIAESALRPRIRSKKGAVGFWQFIKDTGRKYGLVINQAIDERQNLFASTQAAMRYLQELHSMLGSWTLAVAAYNMGEEGLIAETIEQETKDYYKLALPEETQRYVFRILSAKLIMTNPERFGFRLTGEDYYPPLEFEKVKIDCLEDVPIRIVAKAARTHFKMIKDLNPEIRGHYLPPGSRSILVPKKFSASFQPRYRSLVKEFLAARDERVYVIKKGDNLTSIAEKSGVPLSALLIWNRIDPRQPIQPGDHLVICPSGITKHMKFEAEGTEDADEIDCGEIL